MNQVMALVIQMNLMLFVIVKMSFIIAVITSGVSCGI